MYEEETVTGEERNVYHPGEQTAYNNSPANQQEEKKEKKSRKALRIMALSVGVGLAFGICAGLGFIGVKAFSERIAQTKEVFADTELDAVLDVPQEPIKELPVVRESNTDDIHVVANDVSGLVEEVMPAMVTILNKGTEVTNYWGQSYSREISSSGTGIIIGDENGELLVVTNHHVAAEADTLEVTFINGSTAQAYAKGMDSTMDLAVLAVDKSSMDEETLKEICIAKLGDSDSLKLGKPVVVIGNALGYGQSVTTGIISGLNREITMSDGSKGTFIQTNAAINMGNSGGALLNIDGEVIGIVSSKMGGNTVEGMGYAIPISAASPIINDLKEHRTKINVVDAEKAGYLGVSLQTVTDSARQYYGMPYGTFVYEVVPGEAADVAGIRSKDIITKFEGESVRSASDLLDIIQYYEAGETVTITVARMEDGEYVEHEIKVTLGKRPTE